LTRKGLIVTRKNQVSEERLRDRFEKDWGSGVMPSMHWFASADKWRHLSFSYNNPYNIVSVHSEMFLLAAHERELRKMLKGRALVFLGLGVGDTEMLVVEYILEPGEALNLVAVDVNREFIDDFEASLRNKILEKDDYEVHLHRLWQVFEDLDHGQLRLGNDGKRAVVCFGNSIGNYPDSVDFVEILRRTCSCGDLVLLGYQLDTFAKELFDKYKQNVIFSNFVLDYTRKGAKQCKLRWVFDPAKSAVMAYCGSVLVFYSRKFRFGVVRDLLKAAGFRVVLHEHDQARNSAILLAECA